MPLLHLTYSGIYIYIYIYIYISAGAWKHFLLLWRLPYRSETSGCVNSSASSGDAPRGRTIWRYLEWTQDGSKTWQATVTSERTSERWTRPCTMTGNKHRRQFRRPNDYRACVLRDRYQRGTTGSPRRWSPGIGCRWPPPGTGRRGSRRSSRRFTVYLSWNRSGARPSIGSFVYSFRRRQVPVSRAATLRDAACDLDSLRRLMANEYRPR